MMEIANTIGGALLSSSLQILLQRLTSIDLLNYAREGEVLDELKKWDRMLKKIYAVLGDAEGKQMVDGSVRIWVSDLRDLAYDVENILDDFNTEIQRRKLIDETLPSTSKVKKLIPTCCIGLNLSNFKFNAEMVLKIKSITARLGEMIEQKDVLRLGELGRDQISRVKTRPPTSSLLPVEEVYGREDDKLAILDLLNDVASNSRLSVIPIVGMGGIGKTTLAQIIYNDDNLCFDLQAWVSVGENFDIYGITETIIKKLGGGDASDLSSPQERLKNRLCGKKFFIVLDDVWTENYEDWTLFCTPFVIGALGSTLIVTTRSHEVSSMMGTVRAYSLKELSYEDCLPVFTQHALGATNFVEYLHLEEIGREIVKRCQGLPLAAKALGGLLRGKLNRNAWLEVLNSKIWDLSDEKSNILPALRLSYFHLPSHLKQCFAYCAIFPKGYEFNRNELVLLWMAEGFLCQPKGTMQMEELGHQYFQELLSRSFFQESSSNHSLYEMHDLINDLAQSVSGEICFHLGDKLEDGKSCAKVRYSSFHRCGFEFPQRFEVFYKMRNLQTLLALPNSSHSRHYLTGRVLCDLVPSLKCLRALSLSGYWFVELPVSIGALKHLRYLNLSYTKIAKLPESMCELFNLQVLRLHGCKKLVELPKNIYNLIKLQYLDISDTTSLLEMPSEVGCLKDLYFLPKFIVGKENGLRINKLMNFSHLQGQLCISDLQNVVDTRDADFANLKGKHGLDELVLEWIDDFGVSRNLSNELRILNLLQPHQNISSLAIKSLGGMGFPLWIGDPIFSNMMQLRLQNCRNVQSLPPLGRLPLLRKLSIEGMDGVKEVGVEFYEDSSDFACLESLSFKNMLEWEQWSWSDSLNEAAAEQFPKLRELKIEHCPKLIGKLPSCLPSLEELKIRDCPQLVDSLKMLPSLHWVLFDECQEAVLRSLSDISSLTTMRIWRISGLVNLPEALIEASLALKELTISDCGELKYLWQDGTVLDKLTCLESLVIESCEQLISLVEGEEGHMPCNLQVLSIRECGSLEKLPNGLHCLASLRVLWIVECENLVSFPETGLPYSFKHLDITCRESSPSGIMLHGNDKTQKPHLEILEINGCTSFPNGKLPSSLRVIRISHCTKQLLESLYYGLPHLTELEISNCCEFPERGLPIPSLISLQISLCEELRSLPKMQNLKSLRKLVISICPQLESFPESGLPIPTLTFLRIYGCKNLRSLPNQMHKLTSLQSLEIYDCGALLSFPIGGLPPNLAVLSVQNCQSLKQPMSEWGLHRLTSLREFKICGTSPSTDMVVCFPDNDGLLLPTSLTNVYIYQLKNLQSVSKGLQNLTSLKILLIWDCPKLQFFSKEGFTGTLGYLSIKSCPLLKEYWCLKDKGDFRSIISQIPCLEMDGIHIQ